MKKILKSISPDFENDGTFVTLSVPAHYSKAKRTAMLKSARIAGLSGSSFNLINDLNAGKRNFSIRNRT